MSKLGACGEGSRLATGSSDVDNEEQVACPFRVRCHKRAKTGRWKITKCVLDHNCPQFKHKWRGPT
jgi:hypothetical protein